MLSDIKTNQSFLNGTDIMVQNQEKAIQRAISNFSYYEKFYVLKYNNDLCVSNRDELDYYLSKGAAVKHLEGNASIHSIVIAIPNIVINNVPYVK